MATSCRWPGFCFLLLLAGAGGLSPTLRAQVDPDRPLTWRPFIRNVWQDQKSIWRSPFRTSREDAKWWLVFGSATAGLIASDRWTSKQLPNTPDQISGSSVISQFGAAYSVVPGVLAFYVIGARRGDQRLRETGLIGAEALANSLLVNTGLKVATWRERPLEGGGTGQFWKGSGRLWNSGASFPSGHATQVWTAACVVAHEYPRPRIIPIAAYGLASMVTASRFTQRRHFASEVVAGAAIGWFIGDFVFHKRHNRALDGR